MISAIVCIFAFLSGTLATSSSSSPEYHHLQHKHHQLEHYHQKPVTKYVVIKKPQTFWNASKACKAHGLYLAHIAGKEQLKKASYSLKKACVKQAWIASYSKRHYYKAIKSSLSSSSEHSKNWEGCYNQKPNAFVLKNVHTGECGQLKPIIIEIPNYKTWKNQLKYPVLCQTTKPHPLVRPVHKKPVVVKKKIVKVVHPKKYTSKYVEYDADKENHNKFHAKAIKKVVKKGKTGYSKTTDTSKSSFTDLGVYMKGKPYSSKYQQNSSDLEQSSESNEFSSF